MGDRHHRAMTKLALQGSWNQAKGKLKQTYAELTDDNLLYSLGQDEVHLGRLQKQTGAMQEKLRESIATLPVHHMKTMKAALLLLPLALFTLTALPSCREKTAGEKVGDKIDDALDQRPGEKVRDAVEDAKK